MSTNQSHIDNPTVKSPLRVFLCHSWSDKLVVRNLYRRLKTDHVDAWLDEENLLPGQDWHLEIRKAVRSSQAIIICLSKASVTKIGFVNKEIKYALDVADQQPEGAIFIIPLKLEECVVPDRLRTWQWVNFFEPDGYKRLMNALQARAHELEIS